MDHGVKIITTIDERIGSSGKPTYRARVRVYGQTRIKSFKRKTDATTWASNVESELSKGNFVPDAEQMRRTVEDMIDRYVVNTCRPNAATKIRRTRNVILIGGRNSLAQPVWLT